MQKTNKIYSLAIAALMLSSCGGQNEKQSNTQSLAKAYKNYWYTGVSVNQW